LRASPDRLKSPGLKTAVLLPISFGEDKGWRSIMIRLLAVAMLAVFAWFVLLKLIEATRRARIDWTGVATFIAFVVMAFWLRHVTGMG
jgi:hypothetical protein